MRFNYWIFDMDGTLTDSMGIWDKLPFVRWKSWAGSQSQSCGSICCPWA